MAYHIKVSIPDDIKEEVIKEAEEQQRPIANYFLNLHKQHIKQKNGQK